MKFSSDWLLSGDCNRRVLVQTLEGGDGPCKLVAEVFRMPNSQVVFWNVRARNGMLWANGLAKTLHDGQILAEHEAKRVGWDL